MNSQTTVARRAVKPQPGPQEAFCATKADIAFYGGAAGSGKSWAACFELLRYTNTPGFTGIVFRRESTSIRGGGGIWDEACKMYPAVGGVPREHILEFRFPSGARVEFRHLQHENDVHAHQSKQYALIVFEEITEFTARQFWYMVSRNRSTCGVRPYIRATCNPDPDSFVRKLIDWWIGDNGLPIPERSGVLRWFVRQGDEIVWADSKEELVVKYGDVEPLSFTFVAAKLSDNKALLEIDQQYRSRLMALPLVDRERLLGGNWNIRPSAGLYFQKSYFKIVDVAPANVVKRVRAWDIAATEPSVSNPDPDWTVGVKISRDSNGVFYIEHVERFRANPGEVERRIINTASSDSCTVGLWQDPGSAGKNHAAYLVRALSGHTVEVRSASSDKISNASPVSSQAEHGNIVLVRGPWNDVFLSVLEPFPDGAHDDDVDALSLGFLLTQNNFVFV